MRTYLWPLCAGLLLALSFFPFYLWPLLFVALVPLFYFAGTVRSTKELFVGGMLAGLIGLGPLVYFSLFQIPIIPGAEVFYYLARASSIPLLALISGLFGTLTFLYARLHHNSPYIHAALGAALYTGIEIILFVVFGGYYLGSFSRAVVDFPLALAWAAIGGTLLVSFIVAWVNAAIAGVLLLPKRKKLPALQLFLLGAGVVIGVSFGYQQYLAAHTQSTKKISVAVIQIPHTSVLSLPYGTLAEKTFSNPTVEKRIQEASSADLVIYPYTPFLGVTYAGEVPPDTLYPYIKDQSLGVWLASLVPTTTTVMLWNSTTKYGDMYDEYSFWNNNEKVSYKKRELYAYSDYLPAWVTFFGLENRRYTVTPGGEQSPLSLVGEQVGGLICSELHQDSLARDTARDASFILAIGADAMFPGSLAGNYSVATARYAAAANHTPIVRGNINGPSALIAADGSLVASVPFAKEETLFSYLPLQEAKISTLYARAGNAPMYVLLLILLGYVLVQKRTLVSLQSYRKRGPDRVE